MLDTRLASDRIVRNTEIFNLTRLPSSLGSSPEKKMSAKKIQRMYAGTYNCTCQQAIAQIELCNIVAKLADTRTERETRFVVSQSKGHALRRHANNFKRQVS